LICSSGVEAANSFSLAFAYVMVRGIDRSSARLLKLATTPSDRSGSRDHAFVTVNFCTPTGCSDLRRRRLNHRDAVRAVRIVIFAAVPFSTFGASARRDHRANAGVIRSREQPEPTQ
jgi:hypothetical protein